MSASGRDAGWTFWQAVIILWATAAVGLVAYGAFGGNGEDAFFFARLGGMLGGAATWPTLLLVYIFRELGMEPGAGGMTVVFAVGVAAQAALLRRFAFDCVGDVRARMWRAHATLFLVHMVLVLAGGPPAGSLAFYVIRH